MFYEAAMLEHIWCTYGGKGQVFVDCGSSIGNHTLFFAKFCCDGVVSLEPVKESLDLQCDILKLNGIIDKVIPIHCALSDKEGNGRMEKLPAKPWNQGMWRLVEDNAGDVQVATLDHIAVNFGMPKVSLIKIDVEYSEMKVLRGARQTIERDHPTIFVEAPTKESHAEVTKFLIGFDYLEVGCWNASPTYEYTYA